MTAHLKLRIHVTEPWDFERSAGLTELDGWTIDYAEDENEEWEVTLDQGFEYHERRIGRVLVGPRYFGEHLSRVHDAVVGFPVRVAHRQDGGWHYAFIGMLSIRQEDDAEQPDTGVGDQH